jgi:outer membrane protein OmpA-like peptidoglycan-associated protein
MMAKRTVLLGMLICASGVAAFGQPAVVAPNVGGDVGLFTMSTADNPRAGQFTLGMYAWYQPQIAGPFFVNQPDETRYFAQYGGTVSLGLGLTNWWSVFVSGGGQVTRSGGGWDAGYVNSLGIVGPFNAAEGQKIRLGTKFNFHSEVDPDFRIAGWLAGHIPISDVDPTGGFGEDIEAVNSPRTDWEWGAAISKAWFTGMVSYTLSGGQDDPTNPDDTLRVANIVKFGVGATIPVGTPLVQVIIETLYNVYDGGDFPQNDYAQLNGGARIWFGHSGWALSGALGTNLTMLFSNGINPNPFGGILGITYAAWPPAPPPPVVVPAPEPVVEPAPVEPAPPAPVAPPPPRPAPRTTSDEIFFDGKSARLTNIAKAVLDGVALRMKNDLNATAVVTGYTDSTGSEQANLELGAKRAQAAKDYLVTRHGIDPGRIATESKGAADPAYDNTTAEGKAKNRRAQIVVTLVSGT